MVLQSLPFSLVFQCIPHRLAEVTSLFLICLINMELVMLQPLEIILQHQELQDMECLRKAVLYNNIFLIQ